MDESFKIFSDTAKGLAKNPLGVIALFIVLVYGFASLVTAFGSSFSASERIPLIYFLIIFPVLVLGIFAWLVSRHSDKLYSPSDFRNEENYVKMQLSAAASLAVASSRQKEGSEGKNEVQDFKEIVEVVSKAVLKKSSDESWRKRILWVDDRPNNNIYERKAFEAIGLTFTLALSTAEALGILKHERFTAIISDMGRKEGPREGYALLDTIRKQGDRTPFFIYAGSNLPEHKREAQDHGAQGSTNNPQELFQLVTSSIIQEKA